MSVNPIVNHALNDPLILMKIGNNLQGTDLGHFAMVNRLFCEILQDENFWQNKCHKDYPEESLNQEYDITYKNYYRKCFLENTLNYRCQQSYEQAYVSAFNESQIYIRNLNDSYTFLNKLAVLSCFMGFFTIKEIFPFFVNNYNKVQSFKYFAYGTAKSWLLPVLSILFLQEGIAKITGLTSVQNLCGKISGYYNYLKTWIIG